MKQRSSKLQRISRGLFAPLSWPLWVRRTGLLVPPIAAVAWIALVCGVLIATVTRAIFDLLLLLWTAPPQRLRSETTYYDYFQRDRRSITLAWHGEGAPGDIGDEKDSVGA